MPRGRLELTGEKTSGRLSVGGRLISSAFIANELFRAFEGRLGEAGVERARARFRRIMTGQAGRLGPAYGARTIAECVAEPLLGLLGYGIHERRPDQATGWLVETLETRGRSVAVGLIAPWGDASSHGWAAAVRCGVETGVSWAVVINGRTVSLLDLGRVFARRHIELDLDEAIRNPLAFDVLWALARAEALLPVTGSGGSDCRPSLLDEVISRSTDHTTLVCGALQNGVRQALSRLTSGERSGALTLVFRVLFLLYAESRALVPVWHPVYRQSYSLDALSAAIDRGEPPTGFWETLLAISALAHRGCRIDDLHVVPFNGRLFAPGVLLRTPRRQRDATVRDLLLDLTIRPLASGRSAARIVYRDLGVEQLGAVYERLLDDEPLSACTGRSVDVRSRRAESALHSPPGRQRGDTTRKATGAYYTPRSLTDYLVRRTLTPLVDGRSPEEILALRVVDPAMGSGAFLVSACRFLARSIESATIRRGDARPGDIEDADRAGFRRRVAQRCLFGVDLNPMAVQLARLSLWLTTLAADLPLTFLDHHLSVGDSLVGASPADLARQPPAGRGGSRANRALPLFAGEDFDQALNEVLPVRVALAGVADDTADAVHEKERVFDRLAGPASPLARWRTVCDLWCAGWFWPGETPSAAGFAELVQAIFGGSTTLPARQLDTWLETARTVARDLHPLHWPLEFPEVFECGDSKREPGFDAVIGNPPWDVIRGDHGVGAARDVWRRRAAAYVRFVRGSGLYRNGSGAHLNRYQLFVDRALSLTRPQGRIGLVVPWGLFNDHGAAPQRLALFDSNSLDAVVVLDNRRGAFPIHRSMRVALVTATRGGSTAALVARIGDTSLRMFDTLPEKGGDVGDFPVSIGRAALARIGGTRLSIPAVRDRTDVALLERLFETAPALSSAAGWGVSFARELNASDDRRLFSGHRHGLPVLEGKHIGPFVVRLSDVTQFADETRTAAVIGRRSTFLRPRLAYRDVAAPGNMLTLIAAILPARSVSTHTLFCLQQPLAEARQWLLCGLLNSLVLNWIARLWVTTHVTTALVGRLPVPRVENIDGQVGELAALSRDLATTTGRFGRRWARLQARVAQVYRIDAIDLDVILATFPLIDEAVRARVRSEFLIE